VLTVVVNDAWRRVPWADALYAADLKWWQKRAPRPHEFGGQRWSCLHPSLSEENKVLMPTVKLIDAMDGNDFKVTRPLTLGWSGNSGHQAIQLALIEYGARRLVLVGFDLRKDRPMSHFWGNYAEPFIDPRTTFEAMVNGFNEAAKCLPPGVSIVNASEGSALHCFPMASLREALA